MYTQTDKDKNYNGNGNGSVPPADQPIFHRHSKASDVAGRFVEPGRDIADVITKTYIVSDSELNNIIRLWHKVQKCHVIAGENEWHPFQGWSQYKGYAYDQRSDTCN